MRRKLKLKTSRFIFILVAFMLGILGGIIGSCIFPYKFARAYYITRNPLSFDIEACLGINPMGNSIGLTLCKDGKVKSWFSIDTNYPSCYLSGPENSTISMLISENGNPAFYMRNKSGKVFFSISCDNDGNAVISRTDKAP